MKKMTAFFLCLMAGVTAPARTTVRARQNPKPEAVAKSTAGNSAEKQAPAPDPAAKIDPAKEAAIRKLFEAQGAKSNFQQVIAGMSQNLRPLLANSLPPGEYREKLIQLFIERFQSKVKVEQMLDLAIPIYDKYFSKEDVEGLIKFYETPLGRKAASVLPQVALESQAAGMKIGEQMGRDSMNEILEEHPELKKAMEDAAAAANK